MMPPISTILFGIAVAIDGDTLALEGARLHLHGIDAPELGQSCERDGAAYPCGIVARDHLGKLVTDRQVICTIVAHERERVFANCVAERTDLAVAMVDAGWAFAAPHQSRRHLAQEERARTERRGVWQGTGEPPWSWREQNR
jgi:endonuclease YncB( thermonuclease family)